MAPPLTAFPLLARRGLKTLGFDAVRYPHPNSTARHLARVFEKYAVNLVFDVGANTGGFVHELRASGYQGRVVSFEPVSATFQELRRAASRDSSWTVRQYALGSSDGTAEINILGDSPLASFRQPLPTDSLIVDDGFDLATIARVECTETVDVRRLDSVFEQFVGKLDHPRVFLKTDTQGWDLEVIRGAENVLHHIVALQTEMSVEPFYEGAPTYVEALQVLRGYGFVESGFFPVFLDATLALHEFDAIMIRPGAL
jgi:FkbM family methyltransferase